MSLFYTVDDFILKTGHLKRVRTRKFFKNKEI